MLSNFIPILIKNVLDDSIEQIHKVLEKDLSFSTLIIQIMKAERANGFHSIKIGSVSECFGDPIQSDISLGNYWFHKRLQIIFERGTFIPSFSP